MPRKLPLDAFQHYVALGDQRSYRAVAKHYGVAKKTVVARAKEEDWQGQLNRLEEESRERARKAAADELDQIRERQLKGARLLQARALQALQNQPPEKGVRAAGALNIAWKHELFLLGEPTDRASLDGVQKHIVLVDVPDDRRHPPLPPEVLELDPAEEEAERDREAERRRSQSG